MHKLLTAFVILSLLSIHLGVHLFAVENRTPSGTADNASISSKLDKIEANQTEILKQLEELKSELQIVKIRVSSR